MTDHDKLREAIKCFRSVGRETRYHEMATLVLDAAESTLPRTKTVEVWHLEWVAKVDGQNIPQISVHTDKAAAERWRECQQNAPACIGYSRH